MLDQALIRIRERIHAAAARAGRDHCAITVVGVTKSASPESIAQAAKLGLSDIGENRVQEADKKQRILGGPLGLRWHLIGHLQGNKAKRAVEIFDVIHSADSRPLILDLERHAAAAAKTLPVFIQVNISGEATKFGCSPETAKILADAAWASGHLRLTGLMAIAPYADDPQASRPHFKRLRLLRDSLDPKLKLSMGMSQDFETAIEEGADFIRIGTAIFGPRT